MMEKLYAPWRSYYTANTGNKATTEGNQESCVFCMKFAENDDTNNYILRRFTYHAVLLNLYPYNAGHLLIIPYRHIASLDQATIEEQIELIKLTHHATVILKDVLTCHGINIGMNLGKAAGAGIPSHMHLHVLPRWTGDTNFMPLLAQTKPVSFDLTLAYQDLKPAFDKLTIT